jgi:hypothetical protein
MADDQPRLELPNFRVWPTRDLVTMSKAALKHRKVRYAGLPHLPDPVPSPIPAKRAELNPMLIATIARLLPAQASKLSLNGALAELGTRSTPNMYPYAKGPDFSNEGIGYGDVVNVDMICSEKGRPSIAAHSARRTRSGLTALTKRNELLAFSEFTITHTSKPPPHRRGTPPVEVPRHANLPTELRVEQSRAKPAAVVAAGAKTAPAKKQQADTVPLKARVNKAPAKRKAKKAPAEKPKAKAVPGKWLKPKARKQAAKPANAAAK